MPQRRPDWDAIGARVEARQGALAAEGPREPDFLFGDSDDSDEGIDPLFAAAPSGAGGSSLLDQVEARQGALAAEEPDSLFGDSDDSDDEWSLPSSLRVKK